jgi:hypothetical protein
MPGVKPYLRKDRERESEIGRLRIAKKLTLKQVHQLTGVYPSCFLSLQNGTLGPIKKNGELRLAAKKLVDFFGTTPEIAFPRYFCKIRPKTKKVVLMQQLLDACCAHGDHRKDPETLLIKKQEMKQFRRVIGFLTPREEMVIREHMHGKKLWEIAYAKIIKSYLGAVMSCRPGRKVRHGVMRWILERRGSYQGIGEEVT